MLDCGESVYLKLYEKNMIEKYENIYVLLTHLHADHVGSLGSLISYSYYILGKQVIIVHPNDNIQSLLDLMGIGRETYVFKKCERVTVSQIKVEAVPVKHVDDMDCYGYIVTGPSKTFYYSGDACEIPKEVLDGFLNGRIEEMFQDTAKAVSSHKSHLPLEELAEMIPEGLRKRVFCMHFECDFIDEIERLGFNHVLAEPQQ